MCCTSLLTTFHGPDHSRCHLAPTEGRSRVGGLWVESPRGLEKRQLPLQEQSHAHHSDALYLRTVLHIIQFVQ